MSSFEQEQDERLPARRLQEEAADAEDTTGSVEGEAGETVDMSYLSGSNATSDGYALVHVDSNATDEWQDLFPNGSTVKIVYISGSGSSDTIVIVPDDDSSASASDSSSASASEDSSSGSLSSTTNPVYTLPSSNSSSTSGSEAETETSGSMSSALSYSIIFAVVAVFMVVVGVVVARRYTRKRRGGMGPEGRTRTYDLSVVFNANRSRRRMSSPSILGEEAERWRQQRSTDLDSSPMRPTTILADNETLGQLRPTVTLTPLRRTDRLVQATLESNRMRSSTAPVVLYQTP